MSEKVLDITKPRKMIASFLLALVILISLDTVCAKEYTFHPGETIKNNKLSFENTGTTSSTNVYAVASGTATDWVSPTTLQFGSVSGGQTVTKTYTIEVPEDAIVGQDYTLNWNVYSDEGHEGSVYNTIHVREQTPESVVWFLGLVGAIIGGLILWGLKRRKRAPPSTSETIEET